MLKYNLWYNLIFYYALWCIAVFGRDQWVWVCFALLAVHLVWIDHRVRETVLILAVSAIGVAVDSALAFSGIYAFEETMPVLPIPLFLVAIWLGFGATLRHALLYLVQRPWLGIGGAAIGAPLSYWAAERVGAVDFPYGALTTLLLLAGLWVVMMGLFILITREVSTDREAGDETATSSAAGT